MEYSPVKYTVFFFFFLRKIYGLLNPLPVESTSTTIELMSLIFQNPKTIFQTSIRELVFSFSTMSSSSSKIIAEYAKSNRSSCKKCSTQIDNKSLRLGTVSRDPRGFDSTKWYHLNCLPTSISSLHSITGFTSLKVRYIHTTFILHYYIYYIHAGIM